MELKRILRKVQSNYANFFHGRLLLYAVLNTAILAHRCRRGASSPSVTKQAVRWGKQKSLILSHTAELASTEPPCVPASRNGRPEPIVGDLRFVRMKTRYEHRFTRKF
jgi:hypothetical protein